MHNSKIAWFRTITFIIIFIAINYALTFAFVPKGNYSRNTMREMYSQTQNIDVAFVGSSYAMKGINPYIMDNKLGENTFDYAFSSQVYTGTYYSLKELFKYHKPRLVVLTTDAYSYTCEEEPALAYISVELYMKSLLNRIQFYFGSAQDGSYLDRLFEWRGYHIESINQLQDNINGKLDSKYINYPQQEQLETYKESKSGYGGKGYIKVDANDPKNILDYNKIGKISRVTTEISSIKENNVEYLKKIAELCKENNSELILLTLPFPRYQVLKVKNYFEFNEEIAKIANDLGIEYYNYNLIKPEFFEQKGEYFQDYLHLNYQGAEAFSNSLAKFLQLRDSGEDMKKYFCTQEEYYSSVNYITNTWFTWGKSDDKLTLTADALYGTNVVPEYQFVLVNLDTGKSQVIRDYSENPKFVFKCPSLAKYKIRVNARKVGSTDKTIRYYEEIINK